METFAYQLCKAPMYSSVKSPCMTPISLSLSLNEVSTVETGCKITAYKVILFIKQSFHSQLAKSEFEVILQLNIRFLLYKSKYNMTEGVEEG